MNKQKNILCIRLMFVLIFLCTIALCFSGCNEKSSDYPVMGIWHAHNEVKKDNPYNYGGDTVVYDFYFEFAENGVVKNRCIITLNSRPLSDTGWVIANRTWSVSKNVINLSNGRQFVVKDDEFDDVYNNMVLRYYKE